MSRAVARNAVINIVGVVVPALVGIWALRALLHALGAAPMGVFTLALGVLGLSGILDLGISRGITRYVASASGRGLHHDELAPVIVRSICLLMVVGVIAGSVLFGVAPLISKSMSRGDSIRASDVVDSFRWIALSVPFALASSGLLGVLEGYQRFFRLNAIKIPVAVLMLLAPAFVAICSHSLVAAISSMVVVRIFGFALATYSVLSSIPLWKGGRRAAPDFGGVLRFSGWLSVSNIVGPLLVYGDRFYLAATVPAASIAYYTVPFDTAFRATTLPLAGLNTVFPALSHTGAQGGSRRALVDFASQALIAFWLPPLMLAILCSHELLSIWLGSDFALAASQLFQVLCAGVFLNGASHLPLALLHAEGRSDVTAKFHLLELPIYAVSVICLVARFGVLGAAMAWSGRVALDFVLLCTACTRLLPQVRQTLIKLMVASLITITWVLWAGVCGNVAFRLLTGAVVCLWVLVRLADKASAFRALIARQ
jgi:O-antigen/teichoic acid export membrane protein